MSIGIEIRLSVETYILERIITVLTAKKPALPSQRELLIQNAKLQRMIFRPVGPSPVQLLGGASLKKYKKARGKHIQELGEQHKKVSRLADKFFKEYFRQVNPRLTNAEYRKWRAQLDEGILERTKQIANQTDERAVQKLMKS